MSAWMGRRSLGSGGWTVHCPECKGFGPQTFPIEDEAGARRTRDDHNREHHSETGDGQ